MFQYSYIRKIPMPAFKYAFATGHTDSCLPPTHMRACVCVCVQCEIETRKASEKSQKFTKKSPTSSKIGPPGEEPQKWPKFGENSASVTKHSCRCSRRRNGRKQKRIVLIVIRAYLAVAAAAAVAEASAGERNGGRWVRKRAGERPRTKH
ncbi:GD17915 [Drosophila simulans]|uniref:GD17915 n=1 Tax=Drosophila simulans TaxID=7240 RepID=B4QPU2_DROSI|nr:GD17915 [Drosophila simulans]